MFAVAHHAQHEVHAVMPGGTSSALIQPSDRPTCSQTLRIVMAFSVANERCRARFSDEPAPLNSALRGKENVACTAGGAVHARSTRKAENSSSSPACETCEREWRER